MLVFDIETVGLPFESFDEAQQEYLLRYTQTEEEQQRKIAELALSPLTGRIVTIGMRMMTHHATGWSHKDVAYMLDPDMADDAGVVEGKLPSGATSYASSERTMLENFWKLLAANTGIQLISFNGRGFDAPWLMLRSAVLGIRPTRNLMDGTKFSYANHVDLLDKLTFYNRSSSGATRSFNFDFFAKAFGITSPKAEGVDGSKVSDLFAAGNYADIAEYCLRDVRATWELYQKWDQLLRV
ncbi:MAG: ribonuclease H-like domain-containing protein [Bradyrhizobiaceae bacterium]|nr:ribonuclease H-like domain-containing protein [Bradyrhizobiaceae bacterium]